MPMLSHEGKSERAIDGNTAAAHVAYAMSSLAEKNTQKTVCVVPGVFLFLWPMAHQYLEDHPI